MDGRGRRSFPFGAYFQAQGRTVGFGEGNANTHAYYCFFNEAIYIWCLVGVLSSKLSEEKRKTWFCLSRNLLSTTSTVTSQFGDAISVGLEQKPPFHWDVAAVVPYRFWSILCRLRWSKKVTTMPQWWSRSHGERNFDITFQGTTRIEPWNKQRLPDYPRWHGSRPDFVHHL